MFVHLLKQNNGQYVSIAYKIRKCAHFATVRYIFWKTFEELTWQWLNQDYRIFNSSVNRLEDEQDLRGSPERKDFLNIFNKLAGCHTS